MSFVQKAFVVASVVVLVAKAQDWGGMGGGMGGMGGGFGGDGYGGGDGGYGGYGGGDGGYGGYGGGDGGYGGDGYGMGGMGGGGMGGMGGYGGPWGSNQGPAGGVYGGNSGFPELCSYLAEYPTRLQKFTLTGKDSFLTYIEVLQSVKECEIEQDLSLVTLANGNTAWDEFMWSHFTYLCGRYTRILRLYEGPEIDENFIRGLKENKNLKEVEASTLEDSEVTEDIFTLIGSFPLKKITGDEYLFRTLDDSGLELKLDLLEIVGGSDHIDVLCLKNFEAFEIQLNGILTNKFIDDLEKTHKEDKLKSVFILQ
ncbi:hypothetical protein FO519_007679 [Halicephalobus sp. NKZ332]|nr:hypothetical protein FO519_007679 [Halicephalobus sp. NKZ332]